MNRNDGVNLPNGNHLAAKQEISTKGVTTAAGRHQRNSVIISWCPALSFSKPQNSVSRLGP